MCVHELVQEHFVLSSKFPSFIFCSSAHICFVSFISPLLSLSMRSSYLSSDWLVYFYSHWKPFSIRLLNIFSLSPYFFFHRFFLFLAGWCHYDISAAALRVLLQYIFTAIRNDKEIPHYLFSVFSCRLRRRSHRLLIVFQRMDSVCVYAWQLTNFPFSFCLYIFTYSISLKIGMRIRLRIVHLVCVCLMWFLFCRIGEIEGKEKLHFFFFVAIGNWKCLMYGCKNETQETKAKYLKIQ